MQGQQLLKTTYRRPTFLNFFVSFSSIALGAVSIAAFVMKTHVNFGANRKILNLLYWQNTDTGQDQSTANNPSDLMRAKLLDGREPFKYNYFVFFFLYLWARMCCCLCKRTEAVKKYNMYCAARDRLAQELDMLNLIKLMRVNKVVNKALLQRKHRDTIWALSKETTISEEDIKDQGAKDEQEDNLKPALENLLDNFDPDADEWDRLI